MEGSLPTSDPIATEGWGPVWNGRVGERVCPGSHCVDTSLSPPLKWLPVWPLWCWCGGPTWNSRVGMKSILRQRHLRFHRYKKQPSQSFLYLIKTQLLGNGCHKFLLQGSRTPTGELNETHSKTSSMRQLWPRRTENLYTQTSPHTSSDPICSKNPTCLPVEAFPAPPFPQLS